MADGIAVPPVDAAERDRKARDDRNSERGQRGDAEHVDPGRDVSGLTIGKQLVRWEGFEHSTADARGPHPGGRGVERVRWRRRIRRRSVRRPDSFLGKVVATGERQEERRNSQELWMSPTR